MSLKKSRAWFWFAKYIRLRDPKCITCPNRTANAGHFIQAFGHANTFFNEQNVNGQCIRCNLMENGNLLPYRRAIIAKYGKGADIKLEKLGQIDKQWTKDELRELKRYYKAKYESLLKDLTHQDKWNKL